MHFNKQIISALFILLVSVSYGQIDSSRAYVKVSDSIKSQELHCGSICRVAAFPPTDTTSTSLNISLEYRPRTELRNGFRQLRSDTSLAAFFTSHRARLNFDIKKKKFAAALSMQDIRTFGAADPRSNAGTVQVFEAWAEPFITSNLSLRIGKQRFMLDNSRLFAQNDWRNNGGTHDGANLIYKKNSIESQLLFAWNQGNEANFFTDFSPSGFNNYKSLLVSYLKITSKNERLVISTTNYYEGFQYGKDKNAHQNFRYTNGGRLNYRKEKLNLYAMAFVQWGHNRAGKKLMAFYYQAEANYYSKVLNVQLGVEVKSGTAANQTSMDNSFLYPYGVAHAFNGTMEYFANGFAGSAVDFGLIDPYLEFSKIIQNKLKISLKSHLFYSQHLAYNKVKDTFAEGNYLGVESDLNLTYYPNGYTKVDLGVSALKASKAMEYVSEGSSSYLAYWSYLQVSFTPKLFSTKK